MFQVLRLNLEFLLNGFVLQNMLQRDVLWWLKIAGSFSSNQISLNGGIVMNFTTYFDKVFTFFSIGFNVIGGFILYTITNYNIVNRNYEPIIHTQTQFMVHLMMVYSLQIGNQEKKRLFVELPCDCDLLNDIISIRIHKKTKCYFSLSFCFISICNFVFIFI